jgi:hypothetical protein
VRDRWSNDDGEGLRLGADAGFAIGLAYNLEGIAMVCSERNQFERAVRCPVLRRRPTRL